MCYEMINRIFFRNSILPAKIILASIANPQRIRFHSTPKLLRESRILVFSLIMRLSFAISLLVHLAKGDPIIIYLILFCIVMIGANFFASISLLIGVGIRNILFKLFFNRDEHEAIAHVISISYSVILIPIWLLPSYSEYISLILRLLVETFFAKKCTKMTLLQIVVIFLTVRLIAFALGLFLESIRAIR